MGGGSEPSAVPPAALVMGWGLNLTVALRPSLAPATPPPRGGPGQFVRIAAVGFARGGVPLAVSPTSWNPAKISPPTPTADSDRALGLRVFRCERFNSRRASSADVARFFTLYCRAYSRHQPFLAHLCARRRPARSVGNSRSGTRIGTTAADFAPRIATSIGSIPAFANASRESRASDRHWSGWSPYRVPYLRHGRPPRWRMANIRRHRW